MMTSTVTAKKRPNRQVISPAKLTTLIQAADRAAAHGTVRMLKEAQTKD
jgi:hypothetical protein